MAQRKSAALKKQPELEIEEILPLQEVTSEASGAPAPKPKWGRKNLIMLAGGGVLTLLVLVGVGYYLTQPAKQPEKKVVVNEDPADQHLYFTMPEINVPLKNSGQSESFLKMTVILEVSHHSDVTMLTRRQQQLSHEISDFLSQKHRQDISGPENIEKLRDHIMTSFNASISPSRIDAVLFKEIIAQ